jgi:hypothetical protein
MKTNEIINLKNVFLLLLIFVMSTGCERDLSDDATEATYSRTPEIFTDNVIGMGTDFYFPYGGSKPNAWSIDNQVGYNSVASMRFDVPNANDPQGSYAGAIFRVDGAGRNLTDYDALTFYVKASQGVTIAEFGFGEDFGDNKYMATITNVSVGTNWQKVIIPIPDASKLLQERGMFRYAAGSQGTNGFGYTFWIDDLKFEKLGTIAHGQASIMNGGNVSENTFVGVNSEVENVKVTFNMPNGLNQSVFVSPAYMEFTSSNPSVATVNDSGVVTSLSAGTTVITASFGDSNAVGSLTVNCLGEFDFAPVPTRNDANVISIFSNRYNNVPVNYYNGYWQPWQTTVSNDFSVQGDDILNYTLFNFVGIEFSNPTVNANAMTHIHLDVYFPGPIAPGRQLRVLVVDFGANGVFGGADDTRHSTTFTATTPTALVSQSWISIDIPFSAMPNLLSRSHLAQIILEGGDSSSLYVDNIYFYN